MFIVNRNVFQWEIKFIKGSLKGNKTEPYRSTVISKTKGFSRSFKTSFREISNDWIIYVYTKIKRRVQNSENIIIMCLPDGLSVSKGSIFTRFSVYCPLIIRKIPL